ncbi:5-methyltetrahydropteroyltriglutamate--homocysteine S-methyltransferase [uncultured Pseudokineococcus sp.]|uniref:5-methyltetrahydropteroyltriglutamate-- homocysteine S-methyltransferase n=1 Tax=uncultured Pseudokineococcus sp. TaxID=1642928 RepID=UPI0026203E72|nr:5-methyltetrahydropteroyltriglutamate--homocysteine S-methyltransferase [uncultured Pseudokineococcus sp.]
MTTSTSTSTSSGTSSGTGDLAAGPPFRAEHVGSLLRPAAVARARARRAEGEISAQQLADAEDRAVRDLVRRQADVGLQVATDGEVRRDFWHEDFIFALEGVEPDGVGQVPFTGADGEQVLAPITGRRVTGPVRLGETVFADALASLQAAVAQEGTGATPKLTIPSPNMVHNAFTPIAFDGAYDDEEELRADVAAAYREQVARVHAAGLRYLQLDDVSLTFLGDPQHQERMGLSGAQLQEAVGGFVRQFNAALEGRPRDLVVSTHLCRGNFRSAWALSGGYDVVAEQLFNDLDVDAYFLEFDDERSGSLEVLRHLPPGKTVVLGLVTSKTPELEDPDALRRRIDEAARYAPLEQLALSPQCGFSSTHEGNALTEDEQWAKLARVVDVARSVWG